MREFASDIAKDYLDELPSFFSKALFYFIFLLIAVSIIWGYNSKTNVVVSAYGIVAPKNGIKNIKTLEDGEVIDFFASRGDRVEKDMKLATFKNKTFDLISPSSGIVSISNINFRHEFFKAGDLIFSIIPEDEPLIAKIDIPNNGIGKIKVGMGVKIKYNAYPYQEFGLGEGILSKISFHSKQNQKGELLYEGVVELNTTTLYKKNQPYNVFAGLTLIAEIVVEQKRITDFVFEFFKK